MNPESFSCRLVSWNEAYELSRMLAMKIKSSGFQADLIIAIGRGGYVPARVVSDFLLHKLLASIKVEHWDIAASMLEKATVRFPLAVDASGKKLLVIDDVTDTGDTIRAAVDYLSGLGALEIKTGVLQHKIKSSVVPDFYAEEIREWIWIIYPWAAHEDLLGFAAKVLPPQACTVKEIQSRLKMQYGLVPEERCLKDVLDDLVACGTAKLSKDKYERSNSRI
jgi:hypoxanthine phosphoribosyltransferase